MTAFSENSAAIVGLAVINSPNLACALALAPSTPASCLEVLARHESAAVRFSVAENRNTPASAIGLLQRDFNYDAYGDCISLAANPATPRCVLAHIERDTRARWIDHPKSDQRELNRPILFALATNSAVSAERRATLLSLIDADGRTAAPSSPSEQQQHSDTTADAAVSSVRATTTQPAADASDFTVALEHALHSGAVFIGRETDVIPFHGELAFA